MLVGGTLLTAAAYAYSVEKTWPCSGQGPCDPPPPQHLPSRLALWLLVVGVIVLAVTLVVWFRRALRI